MNEWRFQRAEFSFKKIQIWRFSWKCGKFHSIRSPFPYRSVSGAEDRLPSFDRAWVSHRPPSPLLPPPLLENVSYKNHRACTLFWSREIFLFPCVCLKGPAAHPRLHYTLRKYEDICSSLNTPHCLIHLGRYIYNTPFWNAFPSFSPLKTSHPAPFNGTLKNREVRMERWEETRSCGTIFFYIKEFLGLFSVNGRKQLNGYKSVLERGTEMPCHGACEILIWYIYV